MSPSNAVSQSSDTVEFRAYNDDAWYSVAVSLERQAMRIKFSNFSDAHDNVFEAADFKALKQLDEFRERFRPLSKQVQDNECLQLVKGVKVCACHSFGEDDIRFYDAVVDGVEEREHSSKAGEEVCLCRFILFWSHGPNAGSLTATSIENICIVQPVLDLDPVVASFLKVAKEKTEFISSHPISMSKKVSGLEMVAYSNEGSHTAPRLGYFERIQKENRRAKRSIVKVGSSEVSRPHRMEESDLEGIKSQCMILIGNLDKDLCPSTVTEFLLRQTAVSPRVFIFPSSQSAIYTKGAVVLDSEKDFKKLCDFLNNPNHIITSSTGRPWVMMEKLVGPKKINASIGTLAPVSKITLPNGNSGKNISLKVVCSGTKEFEIASELRNLFLEFSNHQVQLYKRLALEERKICS